MSMVLAVAAGGAVGAVARYLMAAGVAAWLGTAFPWGTLGVNVLGCGIMGAVAGAIAMAWAPSPELRAFLAIGVLGGFTTFSAFSFDVAALMERNANWAALAYVLASVVLSIAAFFVGMRLIRLALG